MTYLTEKYNSEDVTKIRKFIREYPFATVIPSAKPHSVGFLPVVEEDQKNQKEFVNLFGHLDLNNPLVNSMLAGVTKLIFMGPNGYISPSDYISKQYPTWNYSVAEIDVGVKLIKDHDQKHQLMNRQIAIFESVNKSEQEYVSSDSNTYRSMLNSIVFFEMRVLNTVARFKYSQEKSSADRKRAVSRLIDKNIETNARCVPSLADLDPSYEAKVQGRT